MAYIGKQPLIGNFQVCDAISTVNGQAAYTLQVGGANVSPETANNMIVSVNGVIQKPNISYTVSGSTITFTSNLVTGDVIDFIQILGNVLDLGVPSDNTVSLAKLTATGTKDATTFLRGDNTFASAGGGLVLQVVSTTKTDTFSVTSGSYTDLTGLSVSITPSSSSNKILVLVNLNAVGQDNQTFWKVVRGATDISVGATAGSRTVTSGGNMYNEGDGANLKNNSLNFLDSPSTTSATTYKIQIYSRSGPTLVNRSSADTDNADYGRSASTITLIEIAG